MEADDVEACEAVWNDAWTALRVAYALPGGPATEAERARLRRRILHLLGTDPGGSWVAEEDGVVVGLAQALVRQGLWVLSLLGVAVSAQGRGVGRALITRALGYGAGGGPGMILSSRDPRAMHRYVSAGFDLHPAVVAMGELDHDRLPGPSEGAPHVRLGGAADVESLADASRRQRGADHEADIRFLLDEGAQLVVAEAGFALFGAVRPILVVADDEATARALLLAGFAAVPQGTAVDVQWITGAQQWAVRTCIELGLELHPQGAVMVRGHPGPLTPYLPSGAFG